MTPQRQALITLPAVALIILAAGASTRLGTPKQLLTYGGQSLLFRATQTALASVCKPVVIVLGAYAEALKQEVKDLPVEVVENSNWTEGMSSSVRTGITALNSFSDQIDAAVLMLCDQPFVSVDVINNLVEIYRVTNKLIIASEYGEALGVPALFSRSLFEELVILKGDVGAKRVIIKHSSEVYKVAFSRGAIDIDTPQDYQEFLALLG
jgi:molybdenum cofactor cytidylyltransferase